MAGLAMSVARGATNEIVGGVQYIPHPERPYYEHRGWLGWLSNKQNLKQYEAESRVYGQRIQQYENETQRQSMQMHAANQAHKTTVIYNVIVMFIKCILFCFVFGTHAMLVSACIYSPSSSVASISCVCGTIVITVIMCRIASAFLSSS